jgi:hypothetical protein
MEEDQQLPTSLNNLEGLFHVMRGRDRRVLFALTLG